MKNTNKDKEEKLNNSACNDFEYEALLREEVKKINKAKYDSLPASDSFKDTLKAEILKKRHENYGNNMKKIFKIFNFPLQPKYSFSAIAIALVLFVWSNAVLLQEDGIIANDTIPKFARNVSQGITDVGTKIIGTIQSDKEKIDDWQYALEGEKTDSVRISAGKSQVLAPTTPSTFQESENIGLSTGGAKDINNFRENINNDYLPLLTDITYEGLFYDYYFDTGQEEACEDLFCPSYSYAVSADPFSKETDYYLSVGLNSGIKEEDFSKKNLNLVVVLDISGSMSSPFNKYYYDQLGNKIEIEESDATKSKMEVAAESVVALIDHLGDGDRFGMVLFNNGAYLAKPLNLAGETDMKKIKDHILEIQAGGGTYMEAGMKMGTELFDELLEADQKEYENRIIFLTDAMPNIGAINKDSLLGITENNADDKLYSTFIGIGIDFNTELVEHITKIKGANYYSVHSSKEFKERMDDEFEYMVTPLVFNLVLTLEADGYEIEKVYGSPEANEATGELMKVNTLFPSKNEGGETRGGLVLLKLKKITSDGNLKLKVSYEDRSGKAGANEADIELLEGVEYFANTGIRKGIALSRYASMVKNWINDERANYQKPEPFIPCLTRETGIIEPCFLHLGQWERQSISLRVNSDYKELFSEFKIYFEKEMEDIGDDSLKQEIDILDELINH